MEIVKVIRVLMASLLALFSFDYGKKRQQNKELKHEAKMDNAYNRGVNRGRVRTSKGNLGVRKVDK